MSKKLCFISFVPLLATIAFAMAPAAATAAEPIWFNEGAPSAEGVEVPTISWGNLSLKGAAEINCHNVLASSAENPTGAKAGKDKIFDFSSYGCEASFSCPAGTFIDVEPQNLPWITELVIKGGKLRDEARGVVVVIGCAVPPEDHVSGTTFQTSASAVQAPLAPNGLKKGTSATHPGFFQYDSESGHLEVRGSSGTVTGTTEGELKTLGYEAQEHTWAEL